MNSTVYVLQEFHLVGDGDYGEGGAHTETRNVGVTLNKTLAELHEAKGVDFCYQELQLADNEVTPVTELSAAMRTLSDNLVKLGGTR